ncbi:DNA repair protein RadA [Mycobacteroides abscessus subsp. massiliense]|uniref:hypothetical protein n=1 Tax=Mycobacteroides abscessus TaxID=36809 RepID=UPI0009A73774|nr:hypothetical protein [Mycobacteroides abscessus]SKF92930.1 DNA repair protein RadA [Mycobacteroides abscessus subsp. massiliense]SKH14008.1 DNA repair protein RadA [Mycobacteroides abscessus subsp. massiliense]SKJ39468.1 DNA repair protein RadA [Mycobacteroides abscessus subsp. massiliense]SKJ75729.1 DNA repair protein RadA [Mycobacteroides abscessus subsp. massiliense]SKL03164.1 DNA repair protein RadA [Mycobacteroides abscessus subsp. massiliense]
MIGELITTESVQADGIRRPISLRGLFGSMMSAGLAAGECLLLAGPAGVGKATLALTTCIAVARSGVPASYIITDGPVSVIGELAGRIGAVDRGVFVAALNDVNSICDGLRELAVHDGPKLVVIDNLESISGSIDLISTLQSLLAAARAGGAALLVVFGQQVNIPLGRQRSILNLVDAVIRMDQDDDRAARLLSLIKNRRGPSPQYRALVHHAGGLEDSRRDQLAAEDRGHSIAVMEGHAHRLFCTLLGVDDGS